MKTFPLALAFAASLGVAGAALADQPGADWISRADLGTKLQGLGYSGVLAEADDGHWEGLAIKDGAIVKFEADARSGEIAKSRPLTDDDL